MYIFEMYVCIVRYEVCFRMRYGASLYVGIRGLRPIIYINGLDYAMSSRYKYETGNTVTISWFTANPTNSSK